MTEIVDFFFSPYLTAQQRRLRAALEDGIAHGSRIAPVDPLPGQTVTLLFSTNPRLPIERVAVYYTLDGTEPLGEKGRVRHGHVIEAKLQAQLSEEYQWQAVLPALPEDTLVRYRADGWSVSAPQLHRYADSVDPVSGSSPLGRVFAYHVDRWTPPVWWRDAIVYQIVVDRFSSAQDEPQLLGRQADINGFFGGTLRGVLEKLDYIEALGVNCIWLSPVFESPTYHGYNPSDYHDVAKRYGGDDALVQLIQEAERRGMRVLLDYVANHTSDRHAVFLAAQSDPTSVGTRWYDFGDTPPGYRGYANQRSMPELMTDTPEVQRYLFDAARYWLDHFGAAGLRLDYVSGPSHAFWTLLQRAIKEQHPQALTIGEITAPVEEIDLYAGRMDAYMDFQLAGQLRRTFATRTASLADLLTFLDAHKERVPATMERGTLLDNHDMHRFLWLAEGNIARLKVAAACHITLEGTPIIFYGTEVGLSQYDDAHKENSYARPPMLWGEQQDEELLRYYRLLLQLRRARPALRYGERITLPADTIKVSEAAREQVGAYVRQWKEESLLIVLNNSEQEAKLSILLREVAGYKALKTLHDLLNAGEGREVSVKDGLLEMTLPAMTAAILA